MIGRRAATVAGKRLNVMAEMLTQPAVDGLRVCSQVSDRTAKEMAEAVRVANEIIYQYYCIPKDVREFWHQEVGADGIPVQDMAEG